MHVSPGYSQQHMTSLWLETGGTVFTKGPCETGAYGLRRLW